VKASYNIPTGTESSDAFDTKSVKKKKKTIFKEVHSTSHARNFVKKKTHTMEKRCPMEESPSKKEGEKSPCVKGADLVAMSKKKTGGKNTTRGC